MFSTTNKDGKEGKTIVDSSKISDFEHPGYEYRWTLFKIFLKQEASDITYIYT
jgi:hypothetical protein